MAAVTVRAAPRSDLGLFRPVPFLGSRLRSASQILDAIGEAYPDASSVADISNVVAELHEALAARVAQRRAE